MARRDARSGVRTTMRWDGREVKLKSACETRWAPLHAVVHAVKCRYIPLYSVTCRYMR